MCNRRSPFLELPIPILPRSRSRSKKRSRGTRDGDVSRVSPIPLLDEKRVERSHNSGVIENDELVARPALKERKLETQLFSFFPPPLRVTRRERRDSCELVSSLTVSPSSPSAPRVKLDEGEAKRRVRVFDRATNSRAGSLDCFPNGSMPTSTEVRGGATRSNSSVLTYFRPSTSVDCSCSIPPNSSFVQASSRFFSPSS